MDQAASRRYVPLTTRQTIVLRKMPDFSRCRLYDDSQGWTWRSTVGVESTLCDSLELLDERLRRAKNRISPHDDVRVLLAPLHIGTVQHVRIPQRVSLWYDYVR